LRKEIFQLVLLNAYVPIYCNLNFGIILLFGFEIILNINILSLEIMIE